MPLLWSMVMVGRRSVDDGLEGWPAEIPTTIVKEERVIEWWSVFVRLVEWDLPID
jgi:hypothetical protein